MLTQIKKAQQENLEYFNKNKTRIMIEFKEHKNDLEGNEISIFKGDSQYEEMEKQMKMNYFEKILFSKFCNYFNTKVVDIGSTYRSFLEC